MSVTQGSRILQQQFAKLLVWYSPSVSTIGGPEKISNSLRLLQTSLTDAVFDAEAENGLHFEDRGRTPEHKANFAN